VIIFELGRSVDKIKVDAQEKGDLGIVAEVGFIFIQMYEWLWLSFCTKL
jgi:hypothetical protein